MINIAHEVIKKSNVKMLEARFPGLRARVLTGLSTPERTTYALEDPKRGKAIMIAIPTNAELIEYDGVFDDQALHDFYRKHQEVVKAGENGKEGSQ